jgi:hypothetical protein
MVSIGRLRQVFGAGLISSLFLFVGLGALEVHDSRHLRPELEGAIIDAIYQAALNGKRVNDAFIQQAAGEAALLQQVVWTPSTRWCGRIKSKVR